MGLKSRSSKRETTLHNEAVTAGGRSLGAVAVMCEAPRRIANRGDSEMSSWETILCGQATRAVVGRWRKWQDAAS